MKTVEQIIAGIEHRRERLVKEARECDISSPAQAEYQCAAWELDSLLDWILDETTSTVNSDD